MSYSISELNTLFYNYLQYSEFLLDISIEYNIAIISTTFDNMGTSYVLKNNNSIIQSINIPILSQHFKIRNEKNEDLDYSIYLSCSQKSSKKCRWSPLFSNLIISI